MPQSFYMGPTRQTLSGMREGGLARRRGQLAMGASRGDPRALESLYMLDPKQAQMIEQRRTQQAEMDRKNKIAADQLAAERQQELQGQIGTISKWVLDKPEEQQEQAYAQALDYFKAAGQDVSAFEGRLDVLPMLAQFGENAGAPVAAKKAFEGDLVFTDGKNFFSQQTFVDPNTEVVTAQLTDVTGQGIKPEGELTPVNKMGLSAKGQADLDVWKEKSKQEVKAEIKLATEPEIQKLVNKFKVEGKSMAEDKQKLLDLESTLPGLYDVVDNLKELGQIATYTKKGKLYDAAVRELGFGATEGATARAKYIATVDNEILPLLKQTFGAAFTFQEGQSLKATLGDPDLSADEKNAQLDAFIEQKVRQAKSLRGKLGFSPEVKGERLTESVNIDIKESSTEDLLNAL